MDGYHGHAHLLEEVGNISKMYKTRPCSMEGVYVGQKAPSESPLFLDILEMAPNFFHGLVWQVQGTLATSFTFSKVFSDKKSR